MHDLVKETDEFDDIEIGMKFDPYEYRITLGRVQLYVESVERPNHWHIGGSPFGGLIGPATICDMDALRFRVLPSWSNRPGWIHSRQEYDSKPRTCERN